MSEKRTIFCSACGGRLSVPAESPAGARARCGRCSAVFSIPERAKKTRTAVGQYQISDLPEELQADINDSATDPDAPVPASAEPKSARSGLSRDALARKAFDLDEKDKPRVQTGARVVEVETLDEK